MAVWCIQICLAWKCATLPLRFAGAQYAFEWPATHVVITDGLSFLLASIVVFLAAYATLGSSRRSRLVLVVYLALISTVELLPHLRYALQFPDNLTRLRYFSRYGLRALVFPALIVLALVSGSVARYLRPAPTSSP